jgi:glycosyltransferase involved in cell wall biosynthesis
MLISFIIPAYNVGRYISKTISSLINQTNKDFEIIIINDGSSDNTFDIANDILSKNNLKNFKIISNKKNLGVSTARNIGLSYASGDYVVFLDGDDYISEFFVEEFEKKVKPLNVQVAFWRFLYVYENEKQMIPKYNFDFLSENNIYTGIFILYHILVTKRIWLCTGSTAFERKFICNNKLKYQEDCVNGEDQEFLFKALLLSRKVCYISNAFLYYFQKDRSHGKNYGIRLFDDTYAFERVKEFAFHKLFDNYRNKTYFNKAILKSLDEHKYLYFLNNIRIITYINNNFSINKIIKYIEEYYPGLMNKLLLEIRQFENLKYNYNLKNNILFFIFKISPFFYIGFYKIYLVFKNFFKKNIMR